MEPSKPVCHGYSGQFFPLQSATHKHTNDKAPRKRGIVRDVQRFEDAERQSFMGPYSYYGCPFAEYDQEQSYLHSIGAANKAASAAMMQLMLKDVELSEVLQVLHPSDCNSFLFLNNGAALKSLMQLS